MIIDVIKILPCISQENLNLIRFHNLAQRLSSHSSKHIANSALEIKADKAELLVLVEGHEYKLNEEGK